MEGFCGICATVHHAASDETALFGERVAVLDRGPSRVEVQRVFETGLIPIDVERRIREEWECSPNLLTD